MSDFFCFSTVVVGGVVFADVTVVKGYSSSSSSSSFPSFSKQLQPAAVGLGL